MRRRRPMRAVSEAGDQVAALDTALGDMVAVLDGVAYGRAVPVVEPATTMAEQLREKPTKEEEEDEKKEEEHHHVVVGEDGVIDV